MTMKDEILRLRAEGKSYSEISKITGSCRSNICYHCGEGQKEKNKLNNKLRKNKIAEKRHPYIWKINHFKAKKSKSKLCDSKTVDIEKIIYSKLKTFHRFKKKENKNMKNELNFTVKDVIDKFGLTPKCYLTGKDIDITNSRSYNFDHIIPCAKGGTNTLDNLGICTRNANMAKTDMTLEEFYQLCEDVINYKNSKISNKN